MLFDGIAKMTKDYTEQKNWEKRLLEEGYSKASAKSAAKKIVGMDQKILDALTRWMEERPLRMMPRMLRKRRVWMLKRKQIRSMKRWNERIENIGD